MTDKAVEDVLSDGQRDQRDEKLELLTAVNRSLQAKLALAAAVNGANERMLEEARGLWAEVYLEETRRGRPAYVASGLADDALNAFHKRFTVG